MPQSLPTSSRFWPDWPTSRCRFHNISFDLASLTFYQPMVEFSGHFDHFHIFVQLTFLVKSTNFWRWFLQTDSRFNLSNFLPTYGSFFQVILTTCFGRPPMSITSTHTHPFYFLVHSLVLHYKLFDAHFQSHIQHCQPQTSTLMRRSPGECLWLTCTCLNSLALGFSPQHSNNVNIQHTLFIQMIQGPSIKKYYMPLWSAPNLHRLLELYYPNLSLYSTILNYPTLTFTRITLIYHPFFMEF